MRPRVLFIDHVGVLGGAELSLLDVVRHVGLERRVLLLDDGPLRDRLAEAEVPHTVQVAPPSVQGVTREGGWWHDLRSVPGLLGMVFQVGRLARAYDVLHANSQKAFVIATLVGAVLRKPVVWHLRDLLTADHFSGGHRRLVIGLANVLAERVIANSEATADAFMVAGGDERKVHVVHNSIDAQPFEAVEDGVAEAVRAELGLGGVPLIGVFSRLSPWKGQHVVLEALAKQEGVHALLVGDALFQDERVYRAQLHELADTLGVADRVHFLGFRDDVPRLMKAVDVMVHASVAPEPFGRVVVEGQLAGRPVVASRGGGVLEIVRHGETGWLVEPGDADALAEALARIFADPEAAARVARAGEASAREHFGLPRLIREMEAQLRAAHGA